jgi:hypothetical protein
LIFSSILLSTTNPKGKKQKAAEAAYERFQMQFVFRP